jgi:outer membrane murein-binding lipoprotein Lpp
MSRPTQTDNTFIAAPRRGVIDFVSAPALYPAEDVYVQAGYAAAGPVGYTMAGYPQGPGQPAYMQAPYTVQQPAMPQGYPVTYAGSPYYAYPVAAAPVQALSQPVSQPQITEDSLQQKVDAKIDSIMTAHKADMLSQQISRLTDKVQKLSNHMDQAKPTGLSSSDSDDEMSRRLRKLAAESSRRASADHELKF